MQVNQRIKRCYEVGRNKIERLDEHVFEVLYEPGDATRYSFWLKKEDKFFVVTGNNDFIYPVHISIDYVQNCKDFEKLASSTAKLFGCNFYTALAVIEACGTILDGKHDVN